MIHREAMARLMERRLSRRMLAFLLASGVQGARHGFQVYLVGGMVRDLLLARPAGDPDLVVQETTPTMDAAVRFGAALAESTGGALGPPSEFGTVKLEVDGLTADLATARRETYASPGALPAVRPAIIAGDMGRRDFTVNAIAVDLAPGRFGAVLDEHGGVGDIESRVIAVLHDDSFTDDPTRLFRAVRYEARHGLRMSLATEASFHRSVGYVRELSSDRVRHELERMLNEPAPERVLARADEAGLLEATLSNLRWTRAMSAAARGGRSPFDSPQGERSPDITPAGPLTYLALAASRLSREDADALIARLNAPREWAAVIAGASALREKLPALGEELVRPSMVYETLEGAPPEAVRAWAALTRDAVLAGRLRDYLDRLRHVRPSLDGSALLAMGVPQGPRVGELLRELLRARLDGNAASRADEEALVRRRLSA